IRFWRMPGKEEINHLAHRDLIGLRGKPSLGAASRGDESAPDEQLQDFRRFQLLRRESVQQSFATASHSPTPRDSRAPSAPIATVLESQARPLDSLLSELIVRNVHNAVSGRAHKIM